VSLVYGPAISGQVRKLLGKAAWGVLPVHSPTATASRLAGAPDGSTDPPNFYRWMTPNRDLAARLAQELAWGLRPRRMALLYADDVAAGSLRGDFLEALQAQSASYPPEVAWRRIRPLGELRFPRGLSAVQEKDAAAAPAAGVATPPAAAAGATAADALASPAVRRRERRRALEAYAASLPAALKLFERQGVDAIGVFGTTEDKLYLLPLIHRYIRDATVFTTHADLALDQLQTSQRLLVVSTLNPQAAASRAEIAEALNLVLPKYVERKHRPAAAGEGPAAVEGEALLFPDVYMLQSKRAASFVLDGIQASVDPPALARWFQANRARVRPERPQLLLMSARGLVSAENRFFSSAADPAAVNPLTAYAGLYFLMLVVGLAHAALLTRAGVAPKTSLFRYEESLQKHFPTLPTWAACQFVFGALFLTVLLVAHVLGGEPISFLPNGVSALPSICMLCQIAGACLWITSRNRESLQERIPELLRSWGRPADAEQFHTSACKIFRDETWQLWAIAVVATAMQVWDYRHGLPISCLATQRIYVVVASGAGWALLFGIIFVLKTWRLNRELTRMLDERPLGGSLPTLYSSFQLMVVPIVEVTYSASVILAGVVLTRWRGFDGWSWPMPVCMLFTVLTGVLFLSLFDIHYRWRALLRAAKWRVLSPPETPSVPEPAATVSRTGWKRRRLDAGPAAPRARKLDEGAVAQLDRTPNWVWSPQLALRGFVVVATPWLAVFLQDGSTIGWIVKAVQGLLALD
jgi:hypothetical protein